MDIIDILSAIAKKERIPCDITMTCTAEGCIVPSWSRRFKLSLGSDDSWPYRFIPTFPYKDNTKTN